MQLPRVLSQGRDRAVLLVRTDAGPHEAVRHQTALDGDIPHPSWRVPGIARPSHRLVLALGYQLRLNLSLADGVNCSRDAARVIG